MAARPGNIESASGRGRGKPPSAASDHRAKTADEAARLARQLSKEGHAPQLGDPASGVMLVVDAPAGPRVTDALRRSLDSVGLGEAYVVPSSTGLLLEMLIVAEPSILVAIGPDASREMDSLEHPLARRPFADAAEGELFTWTAGTIGLRLPPLAPALDDDAAKKRFWRAFLALRDLAGRA